MIDFAAAKDIAVEEIRDQSNVNFEPEFIFQPPDCMFKKCCEKYKKGKRCKKCPLR